jgi:hypothetical protein
MINLLSIRILIVVTLFKICLNIHLIHFYKNIYFVVLYFITKKLKYDL